MRFSPQTRRVRGPGVTVLFVVGADEVNFADWLAALSG
jgi:hypothetical protein